jgi:hypothetical protein
VRRQFNSKIAEKVSPREVVQFERIIDAIPIKNVGSRKSARAVTEVIEIVALVALLREKLKQL